MDLAAQSWFGWSLALIVALPLAVIVLSEVHLRLVRSGNALAKPVNRLRIWLLPLAGLLVLLTQAGDLRNDDNGVRVVATLVGFVAVSTALAGLNAALFGNATEGTWRDRLPSIFIDLARLVLIVAGGAIVASMVWGYDVGGLFAALGVGSIVIGLALQTAIGSVVSGLLLLFEQPFRIGDTLDVGGTRGKVVEMNWRSTHLDIGSGIQIIPNATIAGASFANLSRPTEAHTESVETTFLASDPPHEVTATLLDVASSLAVLRPGALPSVRAAGGGTYVTSLPLSTPADAGVARSQFLTWLWYAARRDELGLDGEAFEQHSREDVLAAVHAMQATFDLSEEDMEVVADRCEIETYGAGERILWEGRAASRCSFILAGVVRTVVATADGGMLLVNQLDRGELLGLGALMHEPTIATHEAVTTVEVLQVPVDLVDDLMAAKPSLGRRLTEHANVRRDQVRDAFAEVNAVASATRPVDPARA